jgi:hypothetical protein
MSPGGFGTVLSQNAWLPVMRTLGTTPRYGGRLLVSRAGSVFGEAGRLASDTAKEQLCPEPPWRRKLTASTRSMMWCAELLAPWINQEKGRILHGHLVVTNTRLKRRLSMHVRDKF